MIIRIIMMIMFLSLTLLNGNDIRQRHTILLYLLIF